MKNNYITIVLAVLLLLAIGYIAMDKWTAAKAAKEQTLLQQGFEEGFSRGYEQAVVQLIQEAVKCQPVPVTYMNSSLQMIALECLQQQ